MMTIRIIYKPSLGAELAKKGKVDVYATVNFKIYEEMTD
jgi:hypothetical protein